MTKVQLQLVVGTAALLAFASESSAHVPEECEKPMIAAIAASLVAGALSKAQRGAEQRLDEFLDAIRETGVRQQISGEEFSAAIRAVRQASRELNDAIDSDRHHRDEFIRCLGG